MCRNAPAMELWSLGTTSPCAKFAMRTAVEMHSSFEKLLMSIEKRRYVGSLCIYLCLGNERASP